MTLPSPFSPQFSDYGVLARLGLVLDEVRLQGGTKLPPEAELCRRLEVDRSQLHRLLQTLAREGVLSQVRSKGWFFPTPKFDVPVSRHNSYTANMVERNKSPRSEVLGIDQVASDDPAPVGFFPLGGPRLWVLDFRRFDGELPFSLARVRIPVDLTPGLNLHVGRNLSLYQALEREYGIRPERRHTWCEAVAADPNVADALGVAVGAPLLQTTHQAVWKGQPFEHTVNFLRADSCRVRIDLAVAEEESR